MTGIALDDRIYVAGHRGLVGGAVVRRLTAGGHQPILTRASSELDLRDLPAVESFFRQERPQVVVLAAAKVGGILANDTYPAEFILDNLMIEANVIGAAHRAGVRKLLFLGSSCIYPKLAEQPISEDSLLTGPLEPTNRPYAIAKIAGVELCRSMRRQHGDDFISAMPTNLYGPGDNFDLDTSHVVPALIRKMHEAKSRGDAEVVVWGTGRARRELLHVDDAADAFFFLLERYDEERLINVGTGVDTTIRELAETIRDVVGFPGELTFDTSKPDGTPQKLLDVSTLTRLGWTAKIPLREGLASTYDWYVRHVRGSTASSAPARG